MGAWGDWVECRTGQGNSEASGLYPLPRSVGTSCSVCILPSLSNGCRGPGRGLGASSDCEVGAQAQGVQLQAQSWAYPDPWAGSCWALCLRHPQEAFVNYFSVLVCVASSLPFSLLKILMHSRGGERGLRILFELTVEKVQNLVLRFLEGVWNKYIASPTLLGSLFAGGTECHTSMDSLALRTA